MTAMEYLVDEIHITVMFIVVIVFNCLTCILASVNPIFDANSSLKQTRAHEFEFHTYDPKRAADH